MKKLKIYLFIILLTGLLSCKKKIDSVTDKKVPIKVTVVAVKQRDIKEYLNFNGTTHYQKKENIRSNVTGYISWLRYKIGDNIRKGQTFASVRTKEQDALEQAVKIDSTLGKFIKPITINSNATGVISALGVTTNDYIAEGEVLATIVEPKSLVVEVNVPYEYEDFINIRTNCTVLLPNNQSFVAKITGMLPIVNANVQAHTFLIALPDTNLPENLNVEVKTIYKEDTAAVTIPNTALQTNELLTDFWVMKVMNDSIAVKQKVIPLLRNDSVVQIKSETVNRNDLIVNEGAYQMQDSTLISFDKQ